MVIWLLVQKDDIDILISEKSDKKHEIMLAFSQYN